jgi:hypothetical protein
MRLVVCQDMGVNRTKSRHGSSRYDVVPLELRGQRTITASPLPLARPIFSWIPLMEAVPVEGDSVFLSHASWSEPPIPPLPQASCFKQDREYNSEEGD